jgi:hypothetical protein
MALDSGDVVQLLNSLVDAFRPAGFAGGNNDFRCASSQKSGCSMEAESSRSCSVFSVYSVFSGAVGTGLQ